MGRRRKLRLMACIELGWRCTFTAAGATPERVEQQFWLHARRCHQDELAAMTPEDKARVSDLARALATSDRTPRHDRARTSPGLRELEDTGQVRRWFAGE